MDSTVASEAGGSHPAMEGSRRGGDPSKMRWRQMCQMLLEDWCLMSPRYPPEASTAHVQTGLSLCHPLGRGLSESCCSGPQFPILG